MRYTCGIICSMTWRWTKYNWGWKTGARMKLRQNQRTIYRHNLSEIPSRFPLLPLILCWYNETIRWKLAGMVEHLSFSSNEGPQNNPEYIVFAGETIKSTFWLGVPLFYKTRIYDSNRWLSFENVWSSARIWDHENGAWKPLPFVRILEG